MLNARSTIRAVALGAVLTLPPLAVAETQTDARADAAPAAEQPASTAAPAPAIRVVAAEKRELVDMLAVTGTIVARQEAAVGTDLNGLIVLALNADRGDVVTKGDVLAVLDRSGLDTQLAQIEATRTQAEAAAAQVEAQITDAEVAVRQAREAWNRSDALKRKGIAAQSQFDNAVNAVDSAEARLVSAKKALAASQAQLGVVDAQKENVLLQIRKTEVRAPAGGLVLSRDATLGGIVSASGAPIFRLAIDGDFELAADVAETELPRLAKGMAAAVRLAGLKEPLEGSIRLIEPEIDQKSRLGSIRVTLPASESVHAGNFARGSVEISRRQGIAVPASAVVYQGEKAFLQVVENGAIRTAPVSLGTRSGDWIEIASGVSAGQDVVARAGTFVADGDRVTPVREEQTGALVP